MKITITIRFIAALALGAVALRAADAPKYGLAVENKILAQKIVNDLMAGNPSLYSAGMHCVPPGGDAQAIVASTLNVIGKHSDPPDIEVGTHGDTIISVNLKIPKIGIMMPLHDREGRLIGALALAFKYRAGEDQVKYFAEATRLRDLVAQRIPSLAELFAPAR